MFTELTLWVFGIRSLSVFVDFETGDNIGDVKLDTECISLTSYFHDKNNNNDLRMSRSKGILFHFIYIISVPVR